MKYYKLIISILSLFIIGFLYDKYKSKIEKDEESENLNLVKKFLLKEEDQISQLKNIKKPILWIPIEYEKNSRIWESFYSRNSEKLNIPYYELSIKSIISKNSDYFHICIIDDSSIYKLLDDERFNISKLSDPQKSNLRLLGLCKLIYLYGGFVIPPSFIAIKSFENISILLENNLMIVSETQNNSFTSDQYPVLPSLSLFGANKNNIEINNLIIYLEKIFFNNFTDQIKFTGVINNYLLHKLNNNKIIIIKSEFLGIKNNLGKLLSINDLLGTTPIEFNNNIYGIFIPNEKILNNLKYKWLCYLDSNSLLKSNINIFKFI